MKKTQLIFSDVGKVNNSFTSNKTLRMDCKESRHKAVPVLAKIILRT